MSYTVELTNTFRKAYKKLSKKYRSLGKDVDNIVAQIITNPYVGADLGGCVRKIRMAISDKDKGKSGGARIITYTIKTDEESGRVTLLTIYDKNEQESISAKEIAELMGEAGL